jgi:cob(I)alamin adenosyltransferase
MKIYTKTGDKGETGLFGGERVSKKSLRIEAYGTIDELNSFIGVAVTEVKNADIKVLLEKIQNDLFSIGSDLATPMTEKNLKLNIKRVPEEMFSRLEKEIDRFEEKLEPLRNFILPGGTRGASLIHVCRTVCRRAERLVTALKETEGINDNILIYLNRLSDLMFVLSRYENSDAGKSDIKWKNT